MSLSTPDFDFATAGRILFGAGVAARISAEAATMGRRALLVCGRRTVPALALGRRLEAEGMKWHIFSVAGEPEVEQVSQGARMARDQRCDLVIGYGGGSALDAAKAIAALATNTRPVETYLEIIGRGRPLDRAPLPCIAVPTTAGTGSEVTRNAVLKSRDHQVKVSLRSPGMLPAVAVVDPALTVDAPAHITAATGCDALTQLLEAFVSTKANALTDALCREALGRAARALPRVVARGDDLAARTEMSLAALFSGLALANGGLGAVHGIAGPLGGMIEAPHGALCARLLPAAVAVNLEALARRQPDGPALARFDEAAQRMLGRTDAGGVDLVAWLEQLSSQLQIPSLRHWGFTSEAVPALVAKAKAASSMKGNPIPLSEEELAKIVSQAM
ncbi:iron-containing alcohol dehydrogenase [Desulfatitalea alkaliphila]|uniref:Iron-containing alcohol dehydrogenase n=1 Tax=Desulfatitalea alkaliphila TaxID=2929485 RepID=A0AA41R2D2_9BACT|nr:iron-containing alcohol dehydrogenase [Desulfatitalea alkaliphila]MCJ8501707.1 iron-containing alcohol dehydrogenase [Desulfatitalea alkaliphila]